MKRRRPPERRWFTDSSTEHGEFLFDLETDPGEARDLEVDQPDPFERLQAAYARWERQVLKPVPLEAARA